MVLSRIATAKNIAAQNKNCFISTFSRWNHAVAQPPSLSGTIIFQPAVTPPLVLPESGISVGTINDKFGSGFYPRIGSMELMAVPKKKTSPHKRGIRNGPKALKPIPVIIRCKACGRVKLPHFFCCSGLRDTDGQKDSAS
ncbi:uncharacterized protein [Rutidosis leptorrhynchoides]|uniref:uncharacterized protein n=1 Tax=Rutidosis leptorrhynchoides TaxID=125765 RepID=UPI003A98D1F4